MAWRLTGAKPLSETMMTEFDDAYMHHLASMSLNLMNKCELNLGNFAWNVLNIDSISGW